MTEFAWIVLTQGRRTEPLRAAIDSIKAQTIGSRPLVVGNGVERLDVEGADTVILSDNAGVPGGRRRGIEHSAEPLLGFLDDDAVLVSTEATRTCIEVFDADARVAVVAMRLVDEHGTTSRRHNPRVGRRGGDLGGDVTTFLGGACAIRRSAYDQVGGYWSELFYGHEELDLSWRLADRGYRVRYVPEIAVFHPRTEIGRHADGWRLTGRNRVWIARRNLPWLIAMVHVAFWFVVGTLRAPSADCRRAYVAGWWSGWKGSLDRRPIRWRTVWQLTRLGRPPVV